MTDSWTLEHDGWTEIWHCGSTGGFDRVVVGGRSFQVDRDDLTALKPQTGTGCEVCRTPLPSAFLYCFACGVALHPMASANEPCQSTPNAGRPEIGLPSLQLADRSAPPEALALPRGRDFAFAVAGEPARLFAFDRGGGWLHEFDRRQHIWVRLFRIGECQLPQRSWSLAAAAAGIVLPADSRLDVVDLTHGPVAQPAPLELGASDACLGGACILRDEAMVPVARGGILQIARRRMLRDAEWRFEPVPQAPTLPDALLEDAELLARSALSAPMVTDTDVSWAGERGYLFATLGDDGMAGAAVWRAWRAGFVPLLGHRPYVDPSGSAWQFGSAPKEPTGRTLSFERVTLGHASHEHCESSVLANGILACRLLTLRHQAWREHSPYDRKVPGGSEAFLVPVQAFGAGCSVLLVVPDGVGRLTELVNAPPDGINPSLLGGVHLYHDQDLHDLGVPMDLGSLGQVAAFVFDRRLYVYDAKDNRCWRWALQPAT